MSGASPHVGRRLLSAAIFSGVFPEFFSGLAWKNPGRAGAVGAIGAIGVGRESGVVGSHRAVVWAVGSRREPSSQSSGVVGSRRESSGVVGSHQSPVTSRRRRRRRRRQEPRRDATGYRP
eukprot:scaffold38896_cov112-Isochrysis_galbana.AAC.1